MDVFSLRDRLISEYREYSESFAEIADERIRAEVDDALDRGSLWPDPRIGLNPSFEPGATVDDLVNGGVLHPLAGKIFRTGKSAADPHGRPMTLHRHQTDAIRAAAEHRSYVLTTGTGSGKSLAYMVPIVDHVLRCGSGGGVKALVLYPMNALANSQCEELGKFLDHGPWANADSGGGHALRAGGGGSWSRASRSGVSSGGDHALRAGTGSGGEISGVSDGGAVRSLRPVSFAVFTGQQGESERQAIRDDPPDVLLTNYVMAELILTRFNDVKLVAAMKSLRFLVLDELHTYRGRQGADVAMLVRRIREACGAEGVQCVGTSATLSTEGAPAERRKRVAAVASSLFGTEVRPSEVISETLRRVTPDSTGLPESENSIHDAAAAGMPADDRAGQSQPLTSDARHAAAAGMPESGAAGGVSGGDFVAALRRSVVGEAGEPVDFESFRSDPLSVWIESAFGVSRDAEGRLVRAAPVPVEGSSGAAERLSAEISAESDVPTGLCEQAVRRRLLTGASIEDPATGRPVFAFRLHQFLSVGGAVHATPEPPEDRSITMRAQRFVRHDRHRVYLPLAFCRACGQEYYVVSREPSSEGRRQGETLVPRDLGDRNTSAAGGEPGLLFIDPEPGDRWDRPWPTDAEGIHLRLPADWRTHDGRLRQARRDDVPVPLRVAADGAVHGAAPSDGTRTTTGFWLRSPFRFCMRCGISHASARGSDFSRLAPLDSQGRSTATTITSLAAVRHLQNSDGLPREARKLLSFTDNRQDASLQAGHLNDFVGVTTLRAALWRALDNTGGSRRSGSRGDYGGSGRNGRGTSDSGGSRGEGGGGSGGGDVGGNGGGGGLTHDALASRVVEALCLKPRDYALQPDAKGYARSAALKALTDVVEYRLYLDLRRGWRVNLPNLEQCGLLRIDYPGLDELVADPDEWLHPLTAGANPEARHRVLRALLETGRRGLAIDVSVLNPAEWGQMERRSEQHLTGPWSVAGELHTPSSLLATGPRNPRHLQGKRRVTSLTPRSAFGQFLGRSDAFGHAETLGLRERLRVVDELAEALEHYGLLRRVDDDGETRTWQIPAAAIVWKPGDGTVHRDPIRMPSSPRIGLPPNRYFTALYKGIAEDLMAAQTPRRRPSRTAFAGSATRPHPKARREHTAPAGPEARRRVEAREHTAQVGHEQRADRERRFREGDLPVLFCSPTMELGVDIAELNVVNMHNVPPTPANYAQRSGRAGRSGQAALVTALCSSRSSHDQYFFSRPELMVSGEVEAPRLDLANEELVRAHVHAVWLACCRLDLGSRMSELLDLSDTDNGEAPSLRLLGQAAATIADESIRRHAESRAQELLDHLAGELADADWFTPGWLDDTMRAIPERFDQALQRWRSLYRSAHRQAKQQGRIRLSHGRSRADRDRADLLRREAERQIELLRGDSRSGVNTDFYPYRYLASEGFLPGYSFPRLPLSAYIPSRGAAAGELLQRPRFLAVSEFGPHSIIYHEGNRYQVNRVQLASEDADAGSDGTPILKTSVKRCEHCGYMHPIGAGGNPDLCGFCSARLPPATRNMFQMGSVSTRRRERITSDEEQRRRQGYEIVSAVRFSERSGAPSCVQRSLAAATATGRLELSYSDAATIWRINQGLRRAKSGNGRPGFVLDVTTGYWGGDESEDHAGSGASTPPSARRTERVIPYVTDTRNALIIKPVAAPQPASPSSQSNPESLEPAPGTPTAAGESETPEPAPGTPTAAGNPESLEPTPDAGTMASLQAALSKALQAVFRLESNEIAAEPLPSRDDRRMLLVYEADEGGAGVLKHLVTDAALWQRVAAEALRICHADPDPANPAASEDVCEAACYDCLMSYSNQLDHALLDRDLAVQFLEPFAEGCAFLHDDHDDALAEASESGLERQFLDFLRRNGYRRPDRGQVFFEDARTRPDFVYEDACAVVYVDGPHHDWPERARRDAEKSAAMGDLGYQVIRFSHRDDWQQVAAAHPAVFGPGS